MSKKNKPAKHEEENGEAWLLPYSDLMTLLLAVFIVLFAVSQVDAEKAKQMSEEFTESMMTENYSISKIQDQESISPDLSSSDEIEMEKLEELKAKIDAKLLNEDMTASVTTSIDKRGLIISLNNAVFFEPGSAEIVKVYEDNLLGIADIINTIDNYIRIEGHTDNVPMSTDQYPSNWELSTARAVSVVKLFINKSHASPEKFVAVGYGEYKPIGDNSTSKGRAKNRRIEIIVLSNQYDDLENHNKSNQKSVK